MSGCRLAVSTILSGLALAFFTDQHALAETGLGPEPYSTLALTGDFVVGGSNTRVFYDPFWPAEMKPPPQTDPFVVTITGIPSGSTIEKAFANWSYLTLDPPYPPQLAQITINGIPVTGTLTGEAGNDLCWERVAFTTRTLAFTADVTSIVSQVGGNGDYTIGGAVDEGGALGEGISLLIIYENSALPWNQVNVYSGLMTTQDGPVIGDANGSYGLEPEPYLGGPVHFFINALDGQDTEEDFLLNEVPAGGLVAGTGGGYNPWGGLLGQGTHNSMYDHAEDDVAGFMSFGDTALTIRTYGFGDCIGHSLGAIAFEAPCSAPPVPDCNGNGKRDDCDILTCPPGDPACADCNHNEIPDECDIAPGGGSVDCNQNQVPDECDLEQSTSSDCQRNNVPDECDPDADGDDVPDECDNCPEVPNPDQADADQDEVGDACDTCTDTDGDTFGDPGFPANTCPLDNCPNHPNPSQADADGDGAGDDCDICPSIPNPAQNPDDTCNPNQIPDECEDIVRWCENWYGSEACLIDVNAANWADADRDGDVDEDDFGAFQQCISGEFSLAALGLPTSCRIYDRNCDGRVDCYDLAEFWQCADGPAVPSMGCSQGPVPPPGPGEPCPLPPEPVTLPPADSDNDGLFDVFDNCPTVANANQWDHDNDGVGSACDNCYYIANADQADADSDGVGDLCDNCPAVANADQSDYSDLDGIGEACDPDIDNDSIANESDNCGAIWNPSQADNDGDGVGSDCDWCPSIYDPTNPDADEDWVGDQCDNCPEVWNYFQEDADEDGIGDACEGEGMMGGGGELMLMSLFGEEGTSPPAGSSIWFVEHGTGASSVSLGSGGGTVVVDLVIHASAPVLGFSAKPAVSTADSHRLGTGATMETGTTAETGAAAEAGATVISIDASGWSDQANALYALGQPGITLPSSYNLNALEWYVVCPSGVGAETGWTLDQITGPNAGEVMGLGEPLSALNGPIDVPVDAPTNGVYTTAASLTGFTRSPPPHGQIVVATLTLQVSAAPGTFTLGVTDASYISIEAENVELATGWPFTITVEGP